MATDTLPQLASAERIGWNPITANLYGVPAFLSGDTPLSAIQNFYRAYVQGQGQAKSLEDCIAAGGGPDCLNQQPSRPSTPGQFDRALKGLPGQTPSSADTSSTPAAITAPIPQGDQITPATIYGSRPGLCNDASGNIVPCAAASAVASINQAGGQASAECGYLDLACYAEKVLGSDQAKDIAKRTVLLAFALVILVVAIISLR